MRAEIRSHADALCLGGLALMLVAAAAVTWQTWGRPQADMGYDLEAARRTAGGELPYVDYPYAYGPVAPLALGGLFNLFGRDLAVAQALGLALVAAVVALTYVLARTRLDPLTAAVASAIALAAAIGSGGWSSLHNLVQPHSFSALFGLVFALAALAVLARWLSAPSSRWPLLVAGALLGLMVVARPEWSILLLAPIVVLALRARLAGPLRARIGDLAVLLAAAAVPIIAVFGAFALAVGPRELVYENLYPVDVLDAGGAEMLRHSAPFTAGSMFELLRFTAEAAAAAACLLALAMLVRRGGRGRLVAIAAAGGMAAFALTRPEWSVNRFADLPYRWVPVVAIVVALVVGRRLVRGRRWDPGLAVDLLLALALAVIAVRTYALFRPGSHAVYAIPLAAVVLARLHVGLPGRDRARQLSGLAWLGAAALVTAGLGIDDARRETATVSASGGTFRAPPAEAAALTGAIAAIERDTQPGDAVLVAPQLTVLPLLTARAPALPQLSLLPGALAGESEEREAIRELEARGVRLALIERRELPLFGNGRFGETFATTLATWLDDRFTRSAALGDEATGIDVWTRRSD